MAHGTNTTDGAGGLPDSADVIVIGGGAVGENAAARAVRGGLSVLLIEHERLGGECSFWACVPSKALLRPGNALAAARRVPGVPCEGPLDARAVLDRRDAFVSHWDDTGQRQWAQGAGVTVVRGRARLAGERKVTVDDGAVLRAEHAVVVCTGSVAVMPDVEGLSSVPVWTSREATSAGAVPGSLAVLGGGVVGVEMAQAWARLGASVDLLVDTDRVLPRMPAFAGERVAEGLRADGVRVTLGTTARAVSPASGGVRVDLGEAGHLNAEHLLVATGRRPATDDLGLDTLGLTPGEPLATDDTGLVTGVGGQWLYAAGDVTGRAPLTHQGKYAARVVGDVVSARAAGRAVRAEPWTHHAATADHHAVPQVVFTDPEVASVGRVEPAEPGHRAVELDIAVAGSSLHADGYTGRARLLVDTEREVLLGATFVGQDVAELLHSATIAVVGEVPLRRLWHAVPAFPTISEVWLRLLEDYGL
ncbi:pyridine nucleotide-disulfide oxidoreductase [Saccharomonospora piscinae]|uniref:Pyridine nucleotide-disulfide oxidoreductase n=1 Tax=Saccharomonospora piscinae TaxID=687388 RepID=A0A1V8ZWX5_SACPI|nr:NAD(P)/FAD-dependent oxidoreductase [Saccharomonospora piscinae]OQO89273.1 pyridine nucleotide-disulfide oxidoreductase [Saccharomonospora piscinae]TLW90961.1 NAD(P)/FAD-dependent oxidoreductase [Saccharomonospora piscinae]